jgi:DNA-binding MarR family transcriptional regulator
MIINRKQKTILGGKDMREEAKQFFQAADKFRTVHYWSIVPWINQVDYSVLRAVEMTAENGPDVYASKVAHCLKRPAPVISRSLKSLEEHGWIVRETNRSDRRNIIVHLTDDGKEILKKVDDRMKEFAGEVFQEYGETELEELTQKILGLYEVVERVLDRKQNEIKEETSADETHC